MNEKKRKHINLQVSEADYKKLLDAANLEHRKISNYLLSSGLDRAAKQNKGV